MRTYFNVLHKGGGGVGDFASLDEARRFCAGETVGNTPPLTHEPTAIEEWHRHDNGAWARTRLHPPTEETP